MTRVPNDPATQRTNEQWLADLRAAGPQGEAALADLRATILNGLPFALQNWLSPDSPHFSALAEEVAQETLVRVMAHLDTFEGRSQFATWTSKIAVRVALSELRRRKWREVSLDNLLESEAGGARPGRMASASPSPERIVEKAELMAYVRQIINEELTERQRQAMTAVSIRGMPLEEVAQRLDTNRNALYKLLHDARLRLKRRVERDGLQIPKLLAVFDKT